jgi:hypothetical protein
MEIEADTEEFPRISDVLLPESDFDPKLDRCDVIEPRTINLPYKEFRELVFFLPYFTDLPILSLALAGKETSLPFIARCIDGDDSSIGDEIFIDPQGFEYPRYKSAILRRAKAA